MAEKKADEFFTRPPSLSRGQQFSRFLYNPSTGELLGRTAKSWGECRSSVGMAIPPRPRLKMAGNGVGSRGPRSSGVAFPFSHERAILSLTSSPDHGVLRRLLRLPGRLPRRPVRRLLPDPRRAHADVDDAVEPDRHQPRQATSPSPRFVPVHNAALVQAWAIGLSTPIPTSPSSRTRPPARTASSCGPTRPMPSFSVSIASSSIEIKRVYRND